MGLVDNLATKLLGIYHVLKLCWVLGIQRPIGSNKYPSASLINLTFFEKHRHQILFQIVKDYQHGEKQTKKCRVLRQQVVGDVMVVCW